MSEFLRPPGVASEEDFRKRCIACGQCAAVCNFHCIEMRPDYFWGTAAPRVYQRKSPCFLCMKCGPACPTGALRDVPMEQSGMGMAYLNAKQCVDYQEKAMIMCWTCYERCPMKGTAIILGSGGYIPQVQDACVGCGVCEYVCPVQAITVTPTRRRNGGS
jgi:NAD-dependent dihydropyrimidine dehydrogenase PreA subunit